VSVRSHDGSDVARELALLIWGEPNDNALGVNHERIVPDLVRAGHARRLPTRR
jgi:hypothetical protein